ncbi:polysaccharide deacetylase family protein [Paenibacillus tarimensis]|uniref:polysaccharide deacetylase family protein n=1 Tax=Paenibacillus tarimensis TaxID=416012 RepID=UPI001F1C08AB|nr:polysaccharide deacetylase family protein [Paenibacillus tarimensis]MCF2945241.1 polysaccharide deacetylase family protein [Paenibacillus tarimensis]
MRNRFYWNNYQWARLLVLMMFLVSACGREEEKPLTITVNGKDVPSAAAKVVNNQVMVPLGFLEEHFQVKAGWSESRQEAPVYYSGKVAVLMYHHVMDKPNKDGIISTAQFEKQMELLKTNGFHVIGLKEYAAFKLEGAPVPDNAVLITFDDGYESFYKEAFPILRKYGYPAVNFIIVATADDPDITGIPKLTWDQMREMQAYGMDFMSHTYALHAYGFVNEKGKKKPLTTGHLYLPGYGRQETDEEYAERVTEDLMLAEKRLREELGNTISAFSFPYGAHHEELLAVTRKLGIRLLFTIQSGLTLRDEPAAMRINAGRSDVTPDEAIKRLKQAGGPPLTITIDGMQEDYSVVRMGEGDSGPLVPLREFCRRHQVDINWNKQARKVELVTQQGAAMPEVVR